ncbi:MAG: methionyl-tRNA formyltransferase [Acidimicrobiia bacterium]
MARVVFLGTPVAAVPALEQLTRHHEVGLVITQPDRPRGRSKRPMPPPVKLAAGGLGHAIAQPGSHAELESTVRDHGPFEVGVVVAYGRIIRPEVLALVEHGMLNVHFSLLPRWRGAAPVARAIMAGDPMSGVTIMRLDEGLDTGPILTAQAVDILEGETTGELTTRLADLGARLLTDVIGRYLDGALQPVSQTDDGLTYADKIKAEDRPIALDSDVATVINQVRGLAPSPAATLEIDGQRHKILAVRTADAHPEPGTWIEVDGAPVIGLADGGLEITALQPSGKSLQTGADWVRGRRRDSGLVG